MQLRARKAFPYANRQLKAGEEFEPVTAHDARILVAIGHAEAGPEATEEILQAFPLRTAAPKRSRGQRGPDKKPRKKRVYQRRDMQAEE